MSTKRTKIIATSWAVAIIASAAIVKLTAIGPVVLTISAKHGWGVHTGDALVLIPVSAAVSVTTLAFRR